MFEDGFQPKEKDSKKSRDASLSFGFDLDGFIKETSFKLQKEEHVDSHLLEKMQAQIEDAQQSCKDQKDTLHAKAACQLVKLGNEVSKKLEKAKNNEIWQEFLQKNDPTQKYEAIPPKFAFPLNRESIEVSCDDTLKITSLSNKKLTVHFTNAIPPKNIEQLLDNIQNIPDIVFEKLHRKLPSQTVLEGLDQNRFRVNLSTPEGSKNYLIIAAGRQFESIMEIDDTGRLLSSNHNSWFEMKNTEKDSFQLIGHQLTETSSKDKKTFEFSPSSPWSMNTPMMVETPGAAEKPDIKTSFQYQQEPVMAIEFKNGKYQGWRAKGHLEISYTEKPYLAGEPKNVQRDFEIKESTSYLPDGSMLSTITADYPAEFQKIHGLTFIPKQQTFFNKYGTKEWRRDFDWNDKLISQTDYGASEEVTTNFDESEKPFYRTRSKTDDKSSTRNLIDKNGDELRSFEKEKTKNPSMSVDDYIKHLAKIIDSPEKWELFIKNFFEYTFDSPDAQNPLMEGKKESEAEYLANPIAIATRERIDATGEYHQNPQETLTRLNPLNEKMKGDCEDYAILAKAILEKQGIKAHVVMITNHAFCAYIKKRPDGRYDAYSIDTGGMAKNGEYLNINQTRSTFANENGFLNPDEAMNSLYAMFGEKKPAYLLDQRRITVLHANDTKNGYYHAVDEIVNS